MQAIEVKKRVPWWESLEARQAKLKARMLNRKEAARRQSGGAKTSEEQKFQQKLRRCLG